MKKTITIFFALMVGIMAFSSCTKESIGTGTAIATIGGEEVAVKWIQLWADGPKFAEYNVGVTDGKVESFGGYYFWGSSIDQDSEEVYKTGSAALSGSDDTATNLWGSEWRMPTRQEFDDLVHNCTMSYKTVKDVIVYKFTGTGDYSSNTLYLPAAGNLYEGRIYDEGVEGYYWSSTPSPTESTESYLLDLEREYYGLYGDSRRLGNSVRAVLAE